MNERELFSEYRRTRDVALRNEIVERYLYIAAVLAKKFVGRGVDYDDLYQVASLALIKGVERFDETLGLQFSTYITPTITGEIKNYFRDHSRLVHLPRKVSELRLAVRRAEEEFLSEEGRKPTVRELAAKVGAAEEEIVRAAEAGNMVSLDKPAEDEEMSLYDVLPTEDDAFERIERKDAVSSALRSLDKTERALVGFRFGEELSQTETAKRMGVSQMYVSRMERKVLSKLKENLKNSMAD